METFATDGGVQPHSQPHSNSSNPADWKSNARDQFPADCGRPVMRRTDELRPHPIFLRHHLAVPAHKLSAIISLGYASFREPLAITHDGIIIDGCARWTIAQQQGREQLPCLEYHVSETEALERFIRSHCGSKGLNAFSRIVLALELEPSLQEKALLHQRTGGQQKGLSKLTKAEQVHVRSEIAKAAAVSVGNITKVKQLKETCVPEYIEALYNDEISIHWAWELRNESPEDQRDVLGRFRFRKGLRTEIRQRAARRRRESFIPQNASGIVNRLAEFGAEKLEAVPVTVLKGAKPEMFITEALARVIDWSN